MSPLTPTLPLTQTPLILAGSFATKPLIAEVATKMHRILPDDKQKAIMDGINQREQQKAYLTTLLEDLKLSQKDYDFSNYEERLLLSDQEIEDILENEIFRKDGVVTELGKSFYEYQDMMIWDLNEGMKVKMKKKLIKEFGLEDRVYESGKWILKETQQHMRIKFENKEQFFQDIQEAGRCGKRNLNASFNYTLKDIGVENFIASVKLSGESGIKILNLWGTNISDIFNPTDLIRLVEIAGKSGIRSLNLVGNKLSQILDVWDIQMLVQTAGKSGIRSLNFERNQLFELPGYDMYTSQGFVQLVKIAGASEIRNLWCTLNNLSFTSDATKQAIKSLAQIYKMNITY